MSRYVYKQLTLVDVAILATFVLAPVFFLFEHFIFGALMTVFVWAWAALWAGIVLAWIAAGIWWVARRIFP